MIGPHSLDDWTGAEPADVLEAALSLPMTVENDGAAGAIGESLFGIGRTVRDFAYLHLINGFGGGIISDGRLFRGARGNAGEFGGIWTVGRMGYHNLDRLRALVNDAGAAFSSVEGMLAAIDVTTPGGAEWLDEAVPAFSALIAMLGYVIDPRAPNRHDLAPPVPQVVRSEVTGDAVALGAAVMPIQRAFLA